jgi:hypothetical protein
MNYAWWYAAIALIAAAIAALWPLSPALASRDALQARIYSVAITAVVCAAIGLTKHARAVVWTAVAIVSAAAGIATLLAHFNASTSCVADYGTRTIVIGRELSPLGAEYVQGNPGSSASDLLLDAGGVPDRVWTTASIRSCRFWLSWGGLSAAPLFAACIGASVARRRFRFAAAAPISRVARAGQAVSTPVYDAFLSYRHTEPDKTNACEVLSALESRGVRVAIDFREFRPNEHFLSEMERCIKGSRFTLCVVTSRYLDSDHCSEEAIISKTLDMADRRKRLVPLIFERVELPVWLHGLVGIDFTESANVDPLDRLAALLATERPDARS